MLSDNIKIKRAIHSPDWLADLIYGGCWSVSLLGVEWRYLLFPQQSSATLLAVLTNIAERSCVASWEPGGESGRAVKTSQYLLVVYQLRGRWLPEPRSLAGL